LNRNQGFLSLRKCVAYKDGGGPTKTITYASVKGTKKTTGSTTGGAIVNQGKDLFDSTYALPGATVDNCERYEVTTPGAIAKEQLAKSLNSTIDEQIQAKSTGGTLLDSIVDLTANLISNGLDKLVTKKTNSKGQNIFASTIQNTTVLGSGGSTSSNSPWYVDTTDIVIQDPNNPRKASPEIIQGIKDIEEELALVRSSDAIMQQMPYSLKLLDDCMPGPDINWESRLNESFERASRKLNKKSEKDKKKCSL
jgi:hypothetical protein